MPTMMPTLYIVAARAGAKKCWRAFSAPINTPLTPKIMGVRSMTRIMLVARGSRAGYSAACTGEMKLAMSHGASRAASPAKAVVAMRTRLMTAEKSRHAPASSSRAK